MKLHFAIGHFRVRLYAEKMVRTEGVTSLLEDGSHFLMWDFDNVDYAEVLQALGRVQDDYALPDIHVLLTSDRSYHAYCFAALPWPTVIKIIAETPGVDLDYFRIGVWRGYFTLRYVAKPGRAAPCAIALLPSTVKASVDPYRIPQFVRYWTHA